MNEEEILRKMSARARMETPPRVDVAGHVMAILSTTHTEEKLNDKPLAWVAIFSAATAITIAILAMSALEYWTNPLLELLSDLTWGML